MAKLPYLPTTCTDRRDRESRGAWGSASVCAKKCRSKSRMDLEDDEIECVWVELRLNKRTYWATCTDRQMLTLA